MHKLTRMTLLLLFLVLIIPTGYSLQTSSEYSDKLPSGQSTNVSLNISDYPDGDFQIIIETDLINSNFKLSGEADISVKKNRVNITDINDKEISVTISGNAPFGKEMRSCEGVGNLVEFDEGPYRYYEVKLIDKDGNVLDRKIATFELTFEELKYYNRLFERLKNPEAKKFSNNLLESGQYDRAVKFLEIANSMEENGGYVKSYSGGLILLVVGLAVGAPAGWKLGERKRKEKREKPPR